jgi:single-stranded-DNA-specific exonuclease
MTLGIDCLLAIAGDEARSLAGRLSQLNADRRMLETRMQDEALGQVDALVASFEGSLPAGLCLFDPGWHQGVVGLVAARIRERVHRPVIAFAPGEPGWVKGSARSVPGLHVRDVLDAVATRHPGLLERFGGHAMAAGMTLREGSLADFRCAFSEEVERRIDPDALSGDLHTDGPLEAGELNVETAIAIRDGGPWGAGFPEPTFDGRFGVVGTRVVGERHLKLNLRAPSGEFADAIAFRYLDDLAAAPIRAQDEVEMVYRTALDEYGGGRRLQLVSEWLAPAP